MFGFDLALVRNDLEALADDEEDHNEQKNLDHVHLRKEKEKKLLPSLRYIDTLCSVGMVLARNDLEALADDEKDHDKQGNLDHVHLLEEKEKDKKTFFPMSFEKVQGYFVQK
jgi:hypothetical protein